MKDTGFLPIAAPTAREAFGQAAPGGGEARLQGVGKTCRSAVARVVGFGLVRSKTLYLSMRID